MVRRRAIRRGPGLLGTMAIGGMGYAAGRGAARRAAEDQAQKQQIADLQAQHQALAAQQQQAPEPYAPQPAPAAATGPDRVAQLKDLAALKTQGILTDDEFEREKQRILSGQ